MRAPTRTIVEIEGQVCLHGTAAMTVAAPLTVTTPPTPWSYALSVPLGDRSSDVVVEATIHVRDGCVGIGTASRALTTIIDEAWVRAGSSPVTIQLFAPADEASRVLLRTGPDARASVTELHELAFSELDPFDPSESLARALVPCPRWNRFYGTAGESTPEKRRVWHYRTLKGPERMHWLEGLEVMIYPRDQLSRALYVSGLYEPNTACAIRRFLNPGAVMIDVGANAGVLSLLASRWVGPTGRVVGIEPSTRERTRLEENLSLNRVTNVTVLPVAVMDREAELELNVAAPEYAGLNTLADRFAYDGVARAAVERVDATTLDRLTERLGLGRIDLVKLDVEGAELAALRGASGVLGRFRPVVVYELFSASLAAAHATPAEIGALLETFDYRQYRIDDDTARLVPVASLSDVDEQNVVAVPAERGSCVDLQC